MYLSGLIKIEGARIYSPIIHLTARNQHDISIIGMFHFASPRFFEAVRGRIGRAESEGRRILYEYVDPCGLYTPEEMVAAMSVTKAFNAQLAQFDLALQEVELPPKSSWICADLTYDNLDAEARLVIRRKVEVAKKLLQDAYRPKSIDVAKNLLKELRLLIDLARLVKEETKSYVVQRDAHAAHVSFEYAQEAGVFTLWGLNHLPGIIRRLAAQGYSEYGREYVLVANTYEIQLRIQKAETG